ncbi:MAG TPA: DUF4160 domain-containing protein [Gemmatimonadaceae bacterium]|nr:DUF4160 domain-containing protein [Gemmatimonadaceae bacterium]
MFRSRTIAIDFPHVTDVRYEGGHMLWLRFSDGVEGRVDLSDLLRGPMFEPLQETTFFSRVRADGYTIVWPNGVDLAPESLYERLRVTGTVAKRPYAQLFDDAMRREAAECAAMPEISRFFGIVIHMFWTEHEAPHFHAKYGEFIASIEIESGAVTTRRFPSRALQLVEEWREAHRDELLANWDRMRLHQEALAIAPLE